MAHSTFARRAAAIVAAALLAHTDLAHAADPDMLAALPAHRPLISDALAKLRVTGSAAANAKDQRIDVSGMPAFTHALRISVSERAPSDYALQYVEPIHAELKKGDVVYLSLWARMTETADESGQGVLGIVLEQAKEPFNKVISRRLSVTREWQQIAVPARLTNDYPADGTHITLRVGGARQTLEIADVQLLKFDDPASIKLEQLPQTRITYPGRESDAPWRKAAAERIEKYRKAPLHIRVVDVAGKPVPNASVTVAMTQHAFPFGCCYNVSSIVGPNSQTDDGKAFFKHFVDLFNVGVDEYAMKWPGWETPETRDQAMAALQRLTEAGIKVRGHCLIWPSWRHMPADIKNLKDDPAALRARIDAHIPDEVAAIGNRVTEWDVLNEPYVNNDVMKILGYDEMARWFKIAHDANPNLPLLLNETSVPTSPPADQHYDVLYDQVKLIQKNGGPISGVGMQAHFGSQLTSPTDLMKIYDRFATLNLPLEITEFDVNVSDRQLAADYLRDFFTISFSHPNIKGILIWGFVANHHWRPDAALFNADYTLRPAGQAWIDLVKKQWWTHAQLTTDPSGACDVRGFLGDYTLTVTDGARSTTATLSLDHGGKSVDVVLK
ncbi:MAG: endo-1,4-beta-xylanase [Tepidisphaeraceae bacterium]